MPKKKQQAVTTTSPIEVADVVDRIPTGWVSLDVALKGGIPCGMLTVIGGKADVGKTNLCTHIVAQYLKNFQEKAVYIDTEGRIVGNPERFYLRGISESEFKERVLLFAGLHTVEGVGGLLRGIINTESPPPRLIILDSLPSLTTRHAFEAKLKEDGKVGLGDLARALQEEFKDLTYYIVQHKIAFVVVTQRRVTISPIPRDRLYLTSFLEHNAAVIIFLWDKEMKEDDVGEGESAFKTPPQSIPLSITPFKKIFFRMMKNHVGYPTAEGAGRYFLIDLPQVGIRRGDFDVIYEIIAFGRMRGLGFLKREGDTYITPSGLRFTRRTIYTNQELHKQVLDECVPLLKKTLHTFYDGSWLLVENGEDEEV